MGALNCKSRRNGRDAPNAIGRIRSLFCGRRTRSDSVRLIDALILGTLSAVKDVGLIHNDSSSPETLLHLRHVADDGEGWIQVVLSMVRVIPLDDSLGSITILVILDDCPLPDKETLMQLSQRLDLCNKFSKRKTVQQHRNICVILSMLAVKLPGPLSLAFFTKDTLNYLFNNLDLKVNPTIILFSLIALEKFSQIRENRHTIETFMKTGLFAILSVLEKLKSSDQPLYAQVGFCAEWILDNIFEDNQRTLTYLNVSMEGVNVILNQEDASEYLKIGPSGLEARCDVCSFESASCTFQLNKGTWYYEVTILTSGIMQIGWSTKNSKHFNYDGCGVGDDNYSVAYDGCRQLVWHRGQCSSCLARKPWQEGDTVGCLLQLETPSPTATFYLNGQIVGSNDGIFQYAKSEFFAAASLMTFQHCCFNFGSKPFKYPPKDVQFSVMNNHGQLDEEKKAILPKRKRMELLGGPIADENPCTICFDLKADVTLYPCKHEGYCKLCAQQLSSCPVCRKLIDIYQETIQQPLATTSIALASEQ